MLGIQNLKSKVWIKKAGLTYFWDQINFEFKTWPSFEMNSLSLFKQTVCSEIRENLL